jgi:transcription initiation factor TFIID subunit 10
MGANSQASGSGQLVNGTSTQANVNGTTPADAATEEAAMPDMNQLYQARRDEEAARRDRSLAEFLVMLDGYKPLVS